MVESVLLFITLADKLVNDGFDMPGAGTALPRMGKGSYDGPY